MSPVLSQWLCPGRAQILWGLFQSPLICAAVCSIVDGKLKCPKCGLEREVTVVRKRGVA